MPRRPRPLPDSLGDEFSVRAARAAGVSRRRLRNDELDRPFRGVRVRPSTPDEWDPDEGPASREGRRLRSELVQHAKAFQTVAPTHSFFWSVTAAAVLALPLPLRVLRAPSRGSTDADGPRPARARDIDVGVHHPHRSSKAAGVTSRQFRARMARVLETNGLRVTDAASTWAHLAEVLTVDELIQLGDAIVRIPRRRGMLRGDPSDALASIADLEAVAAMRRPGVAKLRAALPHIRVGSASPRETELRLALVRAGLPEPEVDFDVFALDGRAIGFTELAYPDFRLLIEYEGDHHRVDRAQWDRDIEKQEACAAAGWTTIRVTSRHMTPSPDRAVSRVRAALIRAGWSP